MKDVMIAETAPAEFGGVDEVGTFTIAANSKAFKILIDGLYSDKIRAVVRELSTNAFDSHLSAGKPTVPFKMTLPSRYDPQFSVRDYGTSLSHKDIMGLYTTVFASTKDKDNNTVGKFGLGSKVPFAYVNTFGVTTWLGGVKRIYSAFMDNGIPKIALFHEEPSDEEQGLEVAFPVQADDVRAFEIAARRVAFGFPVKPTCNIELSTFADYAISMEGKGWKLYRGSIGGIDGFQVRQGCVLYPIDVNALSARHRSDALTALGGETIVLDMPIGTVEITPSRESLSYDSATSDNLLAVINGMFEEFVTNANAQVSAQPTRFEAVKAREAVLTAITNYKLREVIARRIKWRGKALTSSAIRIDYSMMKVLHRRGVRIAHARHLKRSKHSEGLAQQTASEITISPTSVPTFVYYSQEAAPFHMGLRLEAADNQIAGNLLLLRNFTPGGKAETALFIAMGRPACGIKFHDLMTIPFEKPNYAKTLADVSVWNNIHDKFQKPGKYDESVTADQKNVYYVHTVRGQPMNGESEMTTGSLAAVWDQLGHLELLGKGAMLVGIPASRKDIAKNIPPAWTFIGDHLRATLQEHFDIKRCARAKSMLTLNGDYKAQEVLSFFRNINDNEALITDLSSPSLDLQLAMLPYFDGVLDGAKQIALHELSQNQWLTYEERKVVDEGIEAEGDIMRGFWALVHRHRALYPLLGRLNMPAQGDWSAVMDYINLRDARAAALREIEEAKLDAAALEAFEGEGGRVHFSSSRSVISVDFRKAA